MTIKDSEFSKALDCLKNIQKRNKKNKMDKVRDGFLINVFKLDSGEGDQTIEFAILRAFLNSHKKEHYKNLKLALQWDRFDIAKLDIFTGDEIIKESEFTKLMKMAMINDNPQFVELFLENGFDLNSFLTVAQLLEFYNSPEIRYSPQKSPLYELPKFSKEDKSGDFSSSKNEKKPITFKELKKYLKKFIFDDFDAKFLPKDRDDPAHKVEEPAQNL